MGIRINLGAYRGRASAEVMEFCCPACPLKELAALTLERAAVDDQRNNIGRPAMRTAGVCPEQPLAVLEPRGEPGRVADSHATAS